ncbi:MAG: ATP synthase F0 subunit B [Deltaproteobacteria bacterium]|nr:ATP synthase F0 subunit B [Deltaproteobacteria bacterium]
MVSIDVSLFIQMGNFLILVWLLNMFLYRPIREILRKRSQRIATLQNDLNKFEQSINRKKEEIKAALDLAKAKGLEEKSRLKSSAKEDEKSLLQEANQKADEIIKKITAQISDEFSQAKKSLETQAETFSTAMAEKILGRGIK